MEQYHTIYSIRSFELLRSKGLFWLFNITGIGKQLPSIKGRFAFYIKPDTYIRTTPIDQSIYKSRRQLH